MYRSCIIADLANTGTRHGLRYPLRRRQRLDVADAAVGTDHAIDVVGATRQVVRHERSGIRDLLVIALAEEREGTTIQLATGVVLVGGHRGPGIFIQVKAALLVDVRGAGLEIAF